MCLPEPRDDQLQELRAGRQQNRGLLQPGGPGVREEPLTGWPSVRLSFCWRPLPPLAGFFDRNGVAVGECGLSKHHCYSTFQPLGLTEVHTAVQLYTQLCIPRGVLGEWPWWVHRGVAQPNLWPEPSPPFLKGVSIGTKRGCQQNDGLADDYWPGQCRALASTCSCRQLSCMQQLAMRSLLAMGSLPWVFCLGFSAASGLGFSAFRCVSTECVAFSAGQTVSTCSCR